MNWLAAQLLLGQIFQHEVTLIGNVFVLLTISVNLGFATSPFVLSSLMANAVPHLCHWVSQFRSQGSHYTLEGSHLMGRAGSKLSDPLRLNC